MEDLENQVQIQVCSESALQAPEEVTPDQGLIALWLHGKSQNTQEAYKRYAEKFLAFAGVPLAEVTLAHMQAFADHLEGEGISNNSRRTILASVKSLMTFGHRLGLLRVNVGAAVEIPSAKNTLAERILQEADVLLMIKMTTKKRDRAILRLLYAAGLRVSELCSLKWRDLQPRDDRGQVTVCGKGGKTRTILLPAGIWQELMNLKRQRDGKNDPVFRSRNKGQKDSHLSRQQVGDIVRAAAKRAGIQANVSPHWLRHAHASHALDRNAPIHLVQATLGHASIATTGIYLHARPSESSAEYLPL